MGIVQNLPKRRAPLLHAQVVSRCAQTPVDRAHAA
jgi:hypothetical protein